MWFLFKTICYMAIGFVLCSTLGLALGFFVTVIFMAFCTLLKLALKGLWFVVAAFAEGIVEGYRLHWKRVK